MSEPDDRSAGAEQAGAPLVIGFDGSPLSIAAVEWAAHHVGASAPLIVAVHEDAPPPVSARRREVLRADAERIGLERLEAVRAIEALAGCRWTPEVILGETPADALAALARDRGAAAIVVGSHGYGPFQALLGSTSHHLLRISPVPVLIVPRTAVAPAPGREAARRVELTT